jgi:pimeloyl-ACP methyl ester carboxylesterase
VLAALPAWTGAPDTATAAMAATLTAHTLRRDGLASAVAQMRASTPRWLADELTRSWVSQWPALPDAMDAVAGYVAPTRDELATLAVPMGVAAATDDPVHPVEVALEWVAATPRAALHTFTLDELGADPGVLGAACVDALLEL